MDQNEKCDAVTFLIGSTLWPKTPFVTPSHSWLGQRYGPKRDQKLLKNSNKVKKTIQKQWKPQMWRMRHIPYWVNFMAQNPKCDAVKFLIGSTLWPKSWQRDAFTFLIGSTLWPRTYVANSVITSKNCFFSDGVTWRGHRSNLLR